MCPATPPPHRTTSSSSDAKGPAHERPISQASCRGRSRRAVRLRRHARAADRWRVRPIGARRARGADVESQRRVEVRRTDDDRCPGRRQRSEEIPRLVQGAAAVVHDPRHRRRGPRRSVTRIGLCSSAMQLARPLATTRRAHARGAIALMTVILLPVLLGTAALVIDFARLFVFKTELQSAMDACALAAASSLTGVSDPTIFDTARAHGFAMSDPSRAGLAARTDLSVNKLHFHRDNLALANIVVEFSTALGGQPWIAATSASYAGITPQTAKYVRCTYNDANNALFFRPMLQAIVPGALATQSVGATAAASLKPAQSACAFPIAVCKLPGGTSANNYGRTVGERMTAKNSPGGAYGTGDYGWLDFTPPAGGQSELAGLINGSGSCAVTAGTTVGQAGTITSLESNWNARFGVYSAAMSYTTAPPDFTGYGYITGSNNYSDYVARSSARDPYQNGVGGGNSKLTSAQHGSYGQKRRIATAAIVDCSVWSSGSANPTVIDFACILLLAPVRNGGSATQWGPAFATTMDVEYLGLASVPGTP